ncbi:MAG TPA: hypothetical protein VGA56_26800 [Opitutaceae bacterium]
MKKLTALLALTIASIAFVGIARAEDPKPAEGKKAKCCEKAEAGGEKCSHGCCVEAAKAGKNCEKCGGTNTK